MNKDYLWVDGTTAAMLAEKKDADMEALRNGYGYLDVEAFARRLLDNHFRIIIFKNRTAALIEIAETKDGKLLNILTVLGNLKSCEQSLEWLEVAAQEIDVKVIVSIGHIGWLPMMKRRGYYTEPKLLMRKRLDDQATESRPSNVNGAGTAEVVHVG